jgi:hypothetical protein
MSSLDVSPGGVVPQGSLEACAPGLTPAIKPGCQRHQSRPASLIRVARPVHQRPGLLQRELGISMPWRWWVIIWCVRAMS